MLFSFAALRDWQAKVQEPGLSLLFTLQFLLVFLIAPVDTSLAVHLWITKIVLALMSLISVFIVVHPWARALTLVSFALSLIGIVAGPELGQHQISQPVTTLSALLYTLTVSMVVGRKIFSEGPVTLHRIRGAIGIYLNIAICFALVDSQLAAWTRRFGAPKQPSFGYTRMGWRATHLPRWRQTSARINAAFPFAPR